MGVAVLAGTAAVAARQILFTSGLPANVPSLTLDRACCSSMTAAGLAVRDIAMGEVETVIAGGMEAMSQVPLVARGVRWGTRLGGIMLEEPLMMRNPIVDVPIAVGTGDVSLQYGIDREQQDQWAWTVIANILRPLRRENSRMKSLHGSGRIKMGIQPRSCRMSLPVRMHPWKNSGN